MLHEQDAEAIRAAETRLVGRERSSALSEIYEAVKRIALRQICRQCQRRGFSLSPAQMDEKAHDAASYIVRQYLTRSDFTLRKPAAYVYLRVLAELYGGRRKIDSVTIPLDLTEISFFDTPGGE